MSIGLTRFLCAAMHSTLRACGKAEACILWAGIDVFVGNQKRESAEGDCMKSLVEKRLECPVETNPTSDNRVTCGAVGGGGGLGVGGGGGGGAGSD